MNHLRTPTLCAVVIMYNSADEAIPAVGALLAQSDVIMQVILVDNGSSDSSLSRAQEAFRHEERVSLIRVGENKGYSGGANIGLDAAIHTAADYVWLVTDDLEVEHTSGITLARALDEDPCAGLASQYIYEASERDILYYGGGEFGPDGAIHVGRGKRCSNETISPQITGYATGASMFFRPQALRDAGLMDESFWLYWEDVDLSWRIRQVGWRILVVPESTAWHPATSHSDPSMPLRMRYSHRNHLRFLKKHGLADRRHLLATALTGVLNPLKRGDLRSARAYAAAVRDFYLGRSGRIEGRW